MIGMIPLVAALALAGAPAPAAPAADPTVLCHTMPESLKGMRRPETMDGARTYVYRQIGALSLRLHAFMPETIGQRAAVVFFFGGGWSWGTVDQFVPQARHLASLDMVAIVIDYRVFCRDHTGPFEAVADAQEALRWVRQHAGELHVDPHRIAAGGESAGAQLAIMAALSEDPRVRPSALLLYSPALDLITPDTIDFIRGRFGEATAARLLEISPLQHVKKGMPPMLILNGQSDDSTPYAISMTYCGRVTQLGDRCQLIGFPNADHGFFNAPGFPVKNSLDGKWYAEGLADTDRFLVSLGYLQP